MSAIGPGSLGALNIAGSLAGAQQTNATDGEIKQNAADRKSQIDRDAATTRTLEDVGETESSPDRDADGRMPLGHDEEDGLPKSKDESPLEVSVETRRSVDAFGERGGALDLDA